MGPECGKILLRYLACDPGHRIDFYPVLCIAVPLVADNRIYLFPCDLSYSPCHKKTIPRYRDCTVSQAQPIDQIHYDDGHSVHDILKILYFMDRIILASASPRRKQLLEWAEIPFDVQPSDADELIPDGLLPSEIPVFLASQKAAIVRKKWVKKIILAADTIVLLDQQLLGKPLDRSDAIRMLALLSGRVHQVITGVSLTNSKKKSSLPKQPGSVFIRLPALALNIMWIIIDLLTRRAPMPSRNGSVSPEFIPSMVIFTMSWGCRSAAFCRN